MNFMHRPSASQVAGHAFSDSRSPACTPDQPAALRQRGGLRSTSVATANGAYDRMPHHLPSWRLLAAS